MTQPRTYTLEDAAAAFPGLSVSDLRNYIKRRLFFHVGGVPFAGQPRRFDLYGMYEIGFVQLLTKQGLSLPDASMLVGPFISRQAASGFLSDVHLTRPLTHPDLSNPAIVLFACTLEGLFSNYTVDTLDRMTDLREEFLQEYAERTHMTPFVGAAAEAPPEPTDPTSAEINDAGRELLVISTFNVTAAAIQVKAAVDSLG